MDRRDFLKILGAVPLVIAAPSLGQIWLPPEQEIIVPPEISKTIVEGNTICGWAIPFNEMEMVAENFEIDDLRQFHSEFMSDAIMYFPPKISILLLAGDVIERRYGVRQPARTRFIWHGVDSMPSGGKQFRVMKSWNDSSEMLQ
jgi:hypothetical protein